jgi:hypothetical protein
MDSTDYDLAWQLIAEADAVRAAKMAVKEYRLYYNADDGTIIGMWERDHPVGDYIVLSDPDEFHRSNTNLMRVRDGQLTVLDPRIQDQFRLQRSTQGQQVVRGHAVVALAPHETYQDTEFYEHRNN